jgi:hypothetical protein
MYLACRCTSRSSLMATQETHTRVTKTHAWGQIWTSFSMEDILSL